MSSPPTAKSALYRPEALAHQRERAWGELLIITPRAARIAMAILCLLAIAFLIFLFFAEYTRKARAVGVLSYSMDPTHVAAVTAGTLTTIDVKEGDHVRQGQRLATVSTERTVNGEAVFATSAQDAATRRAAIENERLVLNAQLTAQSQQLEARLRAISAERSALAKEITGQQERVAQLQVQVNRYRQLAKDKFVSELQLQQKQDELAEQAVRIETLKRSDATLSKDLALASSELPLLQSATRTRLANLDRDLALLSQTSREDASRKGYDIVATTDAVVERLIATPGQSLIAGSSLLRLQTGGTTLQADLYVPTRSAGFLKIGQSVRVAIDAFPFERYGHLEATIQEIGRAVILPSEPGAPAQLREPAFRVRAHLATQSITAYGERYPLRSGLTTQADISLDQRPLYRWILEPLLRLKGSL